MRWLRRLTRFIYADYYYAGLLTGRLLRVARNLR